MSKSILYFWILCGILNDVLRIPGTPLSLFRILLPIMMVLVIHNKKIGVQYIICLMGLFLLTALQNIVFYNVLFPEINFSLAHFLKYLLLYASSLTVVFVTRLIFIKEDYCEEKVISFIYFVGWIIVVLMIVSQCNTTNSMLVFDNINNYAACLAAWFPIVFLYKKGNWMLTHSIFCLLAILFVLYDAKTALVAIVIQIGMYYILNMNRRARDVVMRITLVLVVVVFVIVLIMNANISINGYMLKDITIGLLDRVIHQMPFDDYRSSLTFRTNSIIWAISMLVSKAMLGFGIGNTSLILRREFPDYMIGGNEMSLHNTVLEMGLDIGIVFLFAYFYILLRCVKTIFAARNITRTQLYSSILLLSSVVWLMGPSGCVTIYGIWMMVSFCFILQRKNKIN